MKKLLLLLLVGMILFSCSKKEDNSIFSELSCEATVEKVTTAFYNDIDTSGYTITEVHLDGDCLSVTISASGCSGSTWEMTLFTEESEENSLERIIKLELMNEEDCLAVLKNSKSFDLTPLRRNLKHETIVHLKGWAEAIHYEY